MIVKCRGFVKSGGLLEPAGVDSICVFNHLNASHNPEWMCAFSDWRSGNEI
jgi:hypothetical protein